MHTIYVYHYYAKITPLNSTGEGSITWRTHGIIEGDSRVLLEEHYHALLKAIAENVLSQKGLPENTECTVEVNNLSFLHSYEVEDGSATD